MDLSTLVKMSNTYGSNPAYVLAGGGNTSVKDDTTLYVKGSGTQLATIKAEEFVKMDRARLNEIMKTEYPADDVKRESAYLADVMAAVTDDDKTKRPSVEALLHNLFAYTYVLHVHPTGSPFSHGCYSRKENQDRSTTCTWKSIGYPSGGQSPERAGI